MAVPCGPECLLPRWLGTRPLRNGPKNYPFGQRSRGIVCPTPMQSTAPWIAKVDGDFYPARYYFTVDYTDSEVADDPAQHKQSHVLELLDAGKYTGNIVALPNNRVRVTHPAWFETGQGAPDFRPSQHVHYSKSDLDYTLDVNKVFDNLYSGVKDEKEI